MSFIEITLPKELVLKSNFLEIINNVEKEIINLDKQKALEVLEKENTDIQKSKALKQRVSQSLDNLIGFEKNNSTPYGLRFFLIISKLLSMTNLILL
ncbi:hypothetical protein [Helicobacter pylori]|uniref:hypothetical protein n=1 Tax=Helicobacter pylori TaxID=210 RepID=UPI00217E0F5D|nr:hypothetical protein [Helicobacter pylori]